MFACRSFDIENDRRLSALTDAQRPQHAETVTVAPLSDPAINAAVAEIGLDETKLNENQRDLLRSPLNLVCYGKLWVRTMHSTSTRCAS